MAKTNPDLVIYEYTTCACSWSHVTFAFKEKLYGFMYLLYYIS